MIQHLAGRLCYVILALLLAGGSKLSAQTLKAVVMGINSTTEWNQDIQHKLMSTGVFQLVDVSAVTAVSLPTPTGLSRYDVVLVYSVADLPTSAANTVGDALTIYMEAGGAVVDMAPLSTQGSPIGGRWRSSGYALLSPAPTVAGGRLRMGAVTNNPLLRGVVPFEGGISSFYSLGQPVAGADVAAFWTNDVPLVITGTPNGKPRVTLNFFPVSSDAREDFWVATVPPFTPSVPSATQLIANALVSVTTPPPPGTCTFTVAPQTVTVSGAGYGSVFQVIASHPKCQWTVSSDVPWFEFVDGQGTGSRSLLYGVDRNEGAARSTTLHIAGRDVVLNQAAGNPAAFDLIPRFTNASHNQAFTGNVTVTAANPATSWTAVSDVPWITILSASPQTGSSVVTYRVDQNPGPRRTGTLTVAGLTYVVNQGGAACYFTLNETFITTQESGEAHRVTVTASSSGCPWTAASESPFIMIANGSEGTGNGSVNFFIAPNASASPRIGTVRIGAQSFRVVQSAAEPLFTVNPASSSFASVGGNGSMAMTVTLADAGWTVVSDVSWITITSPRSGIGSANITYSVSANSGVQRSGHLAIGGQIVTVTQSGPEDVGFTLQPASAVFDSTGGNGIVAVTQTGGVATWSATSNAPWITITAGAAGSGNGTVSYAVAANPGADSRSGTIALAGRSFAVTQAGIANVGSRFVPVIPCRIADTRNPAGPYGGPILTGNSRRTFSVTGAGCGIPASAQAFSLNITAVPNGPLGFLTVWPTGRAQPFVSTLNSGGGRVVANAAIVPAGTGGAVDLFVTNDSHVVIDINGYFDGLNPAALPFFTLAPCRIADTRNPSGPFGGPALAPNNPRSFNVPASPCNVPPSAQAYSLNATAVPAGPLGFLTLWPSSQPQPLVSTLNSFDGRIVANAAIVSAGASGAVNAFANGSTDLVLDTNGYFGPTGNTAALSFFPITPCRVADTRNPNGPFGGPSLAGGGTRSFTVPQSSCGVPGNARAYSLNVTAVPRGVLQYLSIWPADQPQPLVSTLNSFEGAVVANAAIVSAASDGSVKLFASEASDVVIDINGYFAQGFTPQLPAFTLSVNPLSRSVTAGGTATYQVTVASQNGFTGQVMVFLLNAPNNLSGATFTPETLTLAPNGTATSTLTLTSKPAGPFGTATMTVRAGSTGFPTRSQDISLTVNQPAVQNQQVSIRQFQFSPSPVTVARGAQITWTNQDTGVTHTVVADGGQFASDPLPGGQTFTTMPTTPGTYTYHCSIHPFMTGTVVVQ